MSMNHEEKGFILATSLVMLLLMTMLTAAVFISVDSSQKSSSAAESATEAFYYAETAVNYMGWALVNNAEFDSYTYPQVVRTASPSGDNYTFGEPENRGGGGFNPLLDALASGDLLEWMSNRGNPSVEDSVPCAFDSCIVAGVHRQYAGQLHYLDNRPLATRGLVWPDTIPEINDIHQILPRYIRLDIDSYGNITPAMPPYDNYAAPYHGSVVGVDIPENGAIVWLTIGNAEKDIALSPMDRDFAPFVDGTASLTPIVTDMSPFTAKSPLVNYLTTEVFSTPLGTYYQNFPCDISSYDFSIHYACDEDTNAWLTTVDFSLVAYAIGYVNGKPKKLIRVTLPDLGS